MGESSASGEISGKRILLVEDNADDEFLTLRALRDNGIVCHVAVARDGAEALDRLNLAGATAGRGQMGVPDLILLDLKMPKVGGLDVLRRIRAERQTESIPVIVLTTSTQDSDLFDAYRLGANNYIRKVQDFSEFSGAVGHVCRYWLSMDAIRAELNVRDAPAIRLQARSGPLLISDLQRTSERVAERLKVGPPRNILLECATALVLIVEHLRPTLADFRAVAGKQATDSSDAAMDILAEFSTWVTRNAQEAPLEELRDRVLRAQHAVAGILVYIRGRA